MTQALCTEAQRRSLQYAWDHTRNSEFFVVCVKRPRGGGRPIYIEAPEVDISTPTETDDGVLLAVTREAVIRLFMDREEAGYYKETVAAHMDFDPDIVDVTEIPIDALFDLRDALANRASHECEKAGLRFEICTAEKEQFTPTTVDVLWSSERPHN